MQGAGGGAVVPQLRNLFLTSNSVPENTGSGVVVGALSNVRAGSTFALVDSAGTRFALSGSNITTGATPTNYEGATSHNITVRETNATYPNSPRDSIIQINVTNIFEAATLGALSLSDAAFVTGTPESGTIIGATSGSTISGTGLPTGFTINGAARTWAWDGTGSVSTPSITLTETLADSANSGRQSIIGLAITAPAAPTLSALTLSDTSFAVGSPESGTIIGATAGSTITSGALPTGFTFNSAARTWAWDGTGSVSTPAVTFTETLAGATNSGRQSTVNLAITAAPVGISAPVIGFASGRPAGQAYNFGAGGNCYITLPDTTIAAGMYWNVEIASNNTFTAPLAGEGAIRTETLQIIGQDFITGPEFTSLIGLPAGPTYLRIYVTDDIGRTSPVSNVLFDTLAAAPTKFSTTNGVNKNSLVDPDVTGLIINFLSDGNNNECIRTTRAAAAGKTQFEFYIDGMTLTGQTDHQIFIEDGTAVLGPSTSTPPTAGASAIQVRWNKDFGFAFVGGSSGADAYFGGTSNVGDAITLEIDDVADTVKCWLTRSGTTTLQGTKTLALAAYFVTMMPKKVSNTRFNFGASAWTKAPAGGVTGFNG